MKRERLKIYALTFLVVIICFFAIISAGKYANIPVALALGIVAFLVRAALGKAKRISIRDVRNKKHVFWLMLFFSCFYVIVEYVLGLFFGFYRSPLFIAAKANLYGFLLPAIPILISTEYMRHIFLSQKVRHIRLIVSFAMVLTDIVIGRSIYITSTLDGNLMGFGYVLLPAMTSCFLYNLLADHFGMAPGLAFRMVMGTYIFCIPIRPDAYQFLLSFMKTIFPVFVLWFVRTFFTEDAGSREKKSERNKILKYGKPVAAVLATLFLIGLVSNRGSVGLYVIGSESMTGTINKGDCVIYEKYNEQNLHKGEIIIYDVNKGEYQNIHRIVQKKRYNGELVYITKGDANKSVDQEYVSRDKIVGIVRLRVPWVGNLTLWVNDLFKR